ncbi:gag-pol polyprotein [Cucumis melo var. makuwa]|uniref:Gag-pol polyprotein n=1 Tax=Cucumis melo var. makuwa TaxID=1194695 RepID=A0A5D3BN60_CUCMM|nr:gag-pol polyprotein [Cucumis melo var. makuwa]
MEIREGPSASRPPILDGKSYSYWKPHAEEQASVGNARAINAVLNGTFKVKISRLQLIASKFKALRMTEDESVSKYNERVLEIANDSLLLGENIPKSKIVHKVLRSLPRKFDMKETIENQLDNEVNQDESIAHLTKQFSKMARKFKSMNTTGKTVETDRYDGENSTRKVNDFSQRRNSDHGKKKQDVGRSFRCRECKGFGHYQAECPTFLRRQKKNYYATLSDEDSDDDEVNHGMCCDVIATRSGRHPLSFNL